MNKRIAIIFLILSLIFVPCVSAKIVIYAATSLTGGGTGALDAIDGQALQDGDVAIVVATGHVYFYTLNATSAAAESSPDTISPDTNAGDTRWTLEAEDT